MDNSETPKGQSRMDNSETQATLGTKTEQRQTTHNTEN